MSYEGALKSPTVGTCRGQHRTSRGTRVQNVRRDKAGVTATSVQVRHSQGHLSLHTITAASLNSIRRMCAFLCVRLRLPAYSYLAGA